MFFKPKCTCGIPTVNTRTIATLAGNVKVPYCQKCYENEQEWQKAEEKLRQKQRLEEQEERKKLQPEHKAT